MNSGVKTMSEVWGLPEWLLRGFQWRPGRSARKWFGVFRSDRRNSHADDLRLAVAAAQGRAEAMECLIRRMKPQMLNVARGACPTGMDASRVAEVVFLKVFRMLKQYRGDCSLPEWSARAAVGVALREVAARQARRVEWTASMADLALLQKIDSEDIELTPVQRAGALKLFERLLDGLTPAERLVKRLKDLEGMGVDEICGWTGWSVAKTMRIERSARRRVDENLARACAPAA